MDRKSVQESWRVTVQLSLEQRSCDSRILSKFNIRPCFTTQSKAAGARSFVSCPSREQLEVLVLVLFCLLHSADSFSSSCVQFHSGATEHTIEAGRQKFTCYHDSLATKNENSYGGGCESSWSCIDLETPPPRKPFSLQSTSHHGRSHASTSRHVPARSTPSLRKFKERLCNKLRVRKLGPVGNDIAKEEWWTEVVPSVHAQDSVVVDIATTCSKDQTLSSVSFSKLTLDQQNLPLDVVSSPYRCKSTLTAPTTTWTGASEIASATRDSTDSATASSHLHVKFSTATTKRRGSWLLQILEEVEEHLQATSCNGDGPQSEAGSRMTVRRSLLTRSFMPVIVTDSVICVIGFVLAVSALSCWIRQRHAVKSDAAFAVPVIAPSNPVVSVETGCEQNPSPRHGSGLTITGPGRGPPVEESQGRCERAEAEVQARELAVKDERPGRYERAEAEVHAGEPAVEEERPGRWERVEESLGKFDGAEADVQATEPAVEEERRGRWERAEADGPARGPEGEEDRPGRWSQAEEGPGRWETVEEQGEARRPEEDENRTSTGQPVAEESLANRHRVEEVGLARGPEGEEDRPGRWPQAEEGPGSWEMVEEQGEPRRPQEDENRTGTGQPVAEESPSNRQRAEEDGSGTGPPGAGEGSLRSAPEAEGETTAATSTATATAHRSWQTARYRAEPFYFQGLAAATGDFDESNKLGAGSFGTVYRGLLCDGREVAIKRADHNNALKMVDRQCAFKAELDVMSRLHHKHLVNLMGYCDDGDEMMLVYEYMPNGTIADHLHNKRFESRSLSSWKIRVKVALQAAQGVEYLHTYAEPRVIHRDIKSSNLLLDAKGSVRVSDFGLCLIFATAPEDEEDEVQLVSTNAAGTIGYMDPEYLRHHRHLTTKSDVYSFGVVILELLTGERAIHRRNNSHVSVVDYAVPAIEAGELARIVDPRVRAPTGPEFAAMKVMAEVGSRAVRLRGKDRPGMTEIVRRLEQAVTLCQTRHAPLPDFGAQIGSSTDPSYSSSPLSHSSGNSRVAAFHLDPAAAALFDKLVASVEEDEEKAEGTTETDVAQLGLVDVAQVGSLSVSQTYIIKELLGDIPRKIQTTHDDDGGFELEDKSDVNFELYRNAQHNLPGWSFAKATGWPLPITIATAAGSTHAMDTRSSLSSAAAAQAPGYHSSGKCSEPHLSSRWRRSFEHRETLLQELREIWWHSRLSKRVKLGGSGVLDVFPKEGSFHSCEGGSNAASTRGVHLDSHSRKVVDDSSLDQRVAIVAEFSDFGDLGPPEHVHPSPPPESNHGSEPNRGNEPLAVVPGKGERREFSNYATDDIDIKSVPDEDSVEQANSTDYAGFSDFSVLHDLDELMRALHCLQGQQENFKSCRNAEISNSIQGQNEYQASIV